MTSVVRYFRLATNMYTCQSSVRSHLFSSTVLNICSRGMAGHSKWANIRHIKAAKDSQKHLVILAMTRKVRVAAREGGGTNPNLNSKLARVLAEAKQKDVPRATLDGALKRMEKTKGTGGQHFIEVKAPANVMLILETFTSSIRHSRQLVQGVIKRFGGCILDKGGASYAYDFKGVLHVRTEPDQEFDEDAAVALAIEVGAEDVKSGLDDDDEDVLQFICDSQDLHAVKVELENLGKSVTTARLEYLPTRLVPLREQEREILLGLFDKLDTIDDIVRIYDNIDTGDQK